MTMVDRPKEIITLRGLITRNPVVAIIGARQVGKTTLARSFVAQSHKPAHYFDLENPEDEARLGDPMLALKGLKGLIVIDEVQRSPGLFPVLRVLVDRPRSPARFLLLGSASPDLLRQGSETLAGRIVYHELKGLALDEVGIMNHERLWLRGGFPRSYLARTAAASHEWRAGFIRTFLERDLPQLGINIRSTTLRRFWTMLAHYHGQIWNSSEFARSFGVADTTVRNYLDVLASALVINELHPWHENIGKRQIKSPKIYLADTGILHTLLNITQMRDLERHPKLGASWEGWVIGQIIRQLGAKPDECYFWGTHAGGELDLLVVSGRRRLGFEVKRTSSPRPTRSMHNAAHDLKLKTLDVIHAGERTFPLAEGMRAVAFSRLLDDLKPVR
jgi:predicted AAA+ superfamily ATPase